MKKALLKLRSYLITYTDQQKNQLSNTDFSKQSENSVDYYST